MRFLLLPMLLCATSCRDKDDSAGGNDTEDTTQVDTEATDADGDGSPIGEDCNDNDDTMYPGAPETCDGLDNDCDDEVDENAIDATAFYGDSDGDGYGGNTFVVEACEAPQGFVEDSSDCNDLDPSSHPDADEVCDGADNDCDGYLDEPDAVDAPTWYHDTDGDGFGVSTDTETACDAPRDHVSHDGDCDDTNPAFHPGALEADCTDPNDYNCDGSVGFADADGDGFAACDDCDDATADANPDGSEICDGIDNDCDGAVDDDASDASTWYADADGDGHGGAQFSVLECAAPAGYVGSQDDCDDLDATSYPGAIEVCDDADNDCDTEIDEGVGSTWYADSDSDGYGNGSVSVISCDTPSGYVGNALDCDDFSSATNPGSYEICDGADNDCDGVSDEDAINASNWYVDGDGDGYGTSGSTTTSCDQPTGYAANDGDCNDADGAVNPGATETCDSADNDCDGVIDEDDAANASTWYQDLDGDGFGNASNSTTACALPAGYTADDTDCDDTSATTNTSGTETCDFSDNDCDGVIDEDDAADASTWYLDTDGDGYGNPNTATTTCIQPSGYANNDSDCDDTAASANPGASEACDGIDNNCDGAVDESLLGAAETCAGATCQAIFDVGITTSGTYWIDANGVDSAFQVYCDMVSGEGGWTLIAKTNGSGSSHLSNSDVNISDLATDTTDANATMGNTRRDAIGQFYRFECSSGFTKWAYLSDTSSNAMDHWGGTSPVAWAGSYSASPSAYTESNAQDCGSPTCDGPAYAGRNWRRVGADGCGLGSNYSQTGTWWGK